MNILSYVYAFMKMKKKIEKYFTAIFLVIPVTWGGSFIAGKFVVLDVDPLASVFWRFILSALVMFPFLVIFHRQYHPDLKDRQYLIHLFVVALTSGIGYHIFFFWALQTISPTNTALIIALNPFFTALGEVIFFKKARSSRFYFGFVLAFTGAIWVNLSRGNGITLPGKGELFCLLASLTWSFFTIYAKKTKRKEWDTLWLGAYNFLLTAVIILPFCIKFMHPQHWLEISRNAWMALWYMAIFPTAIGYTLYYIGVQKRGPAWTATFIYLVPSFTANFDHIFFGAAFTTPMVAGTTLVVIGLIVGNINRNQISNVKEWWNAR